MDNIKVSIIIPTYNRENFIAECIQSARDQSYPNIEIIVSDNASTDRTWEICQSLAQQDARIVLIRNETNLGPVRNWMTGIEKASGDYCKILFSDDCLEADCLQKMVPRLVDAEVGFVYCAARIGEAPGNSAQTAYALDASKRITPKLFTELLINGQAPVSPCAALMRTQDVRKNLKLTFPTAMPRAYEKNGAGPDAMLLLLTAQAYTWIEHVKEPLVFFRAHAGSFSISNAGNEVVKGYQSVIPYFLKQHHGQTVWLRYLSRAWRLQRRHSATRVPMHTFLIEHEGEGSTRERLAMVWHMLLRPLRKQWRGGHFYTD